MVKKSSSKAKKSSDKEPVYHCWTPANGSPRAVAIKKGKKGKK